MRETLTGSDFVAIRRISTKDNRTLAAPGEACTRVPTEALVRLEARGAIRRVERPEPPRRRGRVSAAESLEGEASAAADGGEEA